MVRKFLNTGFTNLSNLSSHISGEMLLEKKELKGPSFAHLVARLDHLVLLANLSYA